VRRLHAPSFSLLNPSLRPGADGRPIPRAGHAPAPHCVCCSWTRPCPLLIRRSETPKGPHPYGPGPPPVFPAVPPLLFIYALFRVPPLPSQACRSFPPGTAPGTCHLLATHFVSHCFRMTSPTGPLGELFLSFRCVIVFAHHLPPPPPSFCPLTDVCVCVLPSYANASHLHPPPPSPCSSEGIIVSSRASPPRVRAPVL